VMEEKHSRSNANSGQAPSRSCTLAAVTNHSQQLPTANNYPQPTTTHSQQLPTANNYP
jgi:hypothetical protein